MRRLGFILLCGVLGAAVAALGGYLAVSLVVERAPEVTVPDVTGLGLSEALDGLAAQGLDLEVRAFVYSDDVPENRVVRQKPEAGRVVRGGRGVGVVLSRGPERHPVPDMRGLSLEDARILLEEAGLEPEVAVNVRRGPEGEVVGQGVDPGRRLQRGVKVPVVVSSGPRPVLLRMPRLEGMPLNDALGALDDCGLRASRVDEVSLEDPSRQGRVVSQDPLGGFPVPRGGAVLITVAAAPRPVAPWREVWISRLIPPGFARRHVEVDVGRAGGRWLTFFDEWLEGGATLRLWVPLRPGEVARVRIDGEEVDLLGQ